ncbi:MAG TPA: NAD(P)-dependent oxidoreductase [Candidatus Doudnabacteria bacterium]|nr:NAD(P)-dependent oxidoreductase [Candidatus Doudnabacteria bacterium]
MKKTAVLFGGGGFIGSYLAVELLKNHLVEEVLLADMSFQEHQWPQELHKLRSEGRVATATFDVRRKEDFLYLTVKPELIVNLAAIHREPGHAEHEYYDTNIPGAENICNWAESVNCLNIIFTSSIAVYGANEAINPEPKTEQTPTKPNSPYGISKLKAEEIHKTWQQKNSERKLLIVRPGVIFGAGENGNVTRMLKALKRGYFVFAGNKDTAKAGGYVKELCRSIVWMWQRQIQNNSQKELYNFTVEPTPTVGQYVTAINNVLGKPSRTINLPYGLLMFAAQVIQKLSSIVGRTAGINPARIRKLRRSNYIVAEVLQKAGYKYHYNLDSAMRDWQNERPQDWS